MLCSGPLGSLEERKLTLFLRTELHLFGIMGLATCSELNADMPRVVHEQTLIV